MRKLFTQIMIAYIFLTIKDQQLTKIAESLGTPKTLPIYKLGAIANKSLNSLGKFIFIFELVPLVAVEYYFLTPCKQ